MAQSMLVLAHRIEATWCIPLQSGTCSILSVEIYCYAVDGDRLTLYEERWIKADL
jgi:hypothetical protein